MKSLLIYAFALLLTVPAYATGKTHVGDNVHGGNAKANAESTLIDKSNHSASADAEATVINSPVFNDAFDAAFNAAFKATIETYFNPSLYVTDTQQQQQWQTATANNEGVHATGNVVGIDIDYPDYLPPLPAAPNTGFETPQLYSFEGTEGSLVSARHELDSAMRPDWTEIRTDNGVRMTISGIDEVEVFEELEQECEIVVSTTLPATAQYLKITAQPNKDGNDITVGRMETTVKKWLNDNYGGLTAYIVESGTAKGVRSDGRGAGTSASGGFNPVDDVVGGIASTFTGSHARTVMDGRITLYFEVYESE